MYDVNGLPSMVMSTRWAASLTLTSTPPAAVRDPPSAARAMMPRVRAARMKPAPCERPTLAVKSVAHDYQIQARHCLRRLARRGCAACRPGEETGHAHHDRQWRWRMGPALR